MMLAIRRAFALLDPRTRRRIPLLLASFAVIAALDAVGIGLVFPLVLAMSDPAAMQRAGWLKQLADLTGIREQGPFIMLVGGMVAGLFALKGAVSVGLLWWQYRLLFKSEAEIGTRLLDRYLRMPWQSISTRNSSELIRNASVSTSHFYLSFVIPAMTLAVETFVAATVLVLLLIIDARIALLSGLLVTTVGTGYFLLVRDRLSRIGAEFQQASFEVLNHLKQALGAGREVRILGRQDEFVRQLAAARDLYARSLTARSVLQQLPRYFLEVFLVIIVVCMIAVAVAARPMSEVVPVLAVFAVAALRLVGSVARILQAAQQLRIGAPAVLAVDADLTGADTLAPAQPARAEHPRPALPGLTMEAVGFWYTPDRPVLVRIDLAVHWGESIGVVGPSGSGKSTLMDIMIGLLPPCAGRVLVDGRDIARDQAKWRARIGYVPQSAYLSDDTIARNVAFGLSDAAIDRGKVLRALELAQLAPFVGSLRNGVEARLGELGSTLSGGQRQRVAIARALYHDPDVLFLDEATSALDSETEQAVVETLNALRGHKTLVVIAHRLSTLAGCDRIVALADGRLVDAPSQPPRQEARASAHSLLPAGRLP